MRKKLSLPETLARADLIETAVNISRHAILGWVLDDHKPTLDELRWLGSTLSRFSEATENAQQVPVAEGEAIFKRAEIEMLEKHRDLYVL